MDEPSNDLGQLFMAPLFAGEDPRATVIPLIRDLGVGAVILLGHWRGGVEQIRHATDMLQRQAPDGRPLIIAVDQEGGLIQHAEGPGFDVMPAATEQGALPCDELRRRAGRWGGQLREAGVNVDLAPVTDTVDPTHREDNKPVGDLNRDFGADPHGNARHAVAFIEGMRDAGIGTTLKHYPGLGFIEENTDFADTGITDKATALDSPSVHAFGQALEAHPDMVMMSSAIYPRIDPDNPAVLSARIIGHLRRDFPEGVVISDSLSAKAMSHYPTDALGAALVLAGVDMLCICDSDIVRPIFDGLRRRCDADDDVRRAVQRSVGRIMTLKRRLMAGL